MQVVPDDPQFAAGGDRVEDRAGKEPAAIGPPHVVAHALDVHALPRPSGAFTVCHGEWMARLKLVLAAPAVRGEYLKINSEMQEALAEAGGWVNEEEFTVPAGPGD